MAAKFCYVYVLRSVADGQFYTGFTRDLRARFQQHENGEVKSTCHRLPVELIYYEACRSPTDAARRERYLKSAWGKRFIKGRLRHYLTG